MIQKRRFSLPLAMALATFAVASLAPGRNLHGDERSANAARTRAEIERKSRDIKKTVEDQQRKVRERLNLPDPTSGGSAAPGKAPLPSAGALRKNGKLPDPRALAKTPPSGMKKNSVEYSPKRGQEFVFLVEMSTQDGGLEKQWVGTPYFAGIYSGVHSYAEMFCIGGLACRIRSSPDRPWTPVSLEDIELPQRFMFGSCGVLNTATASLFDPHTLPLQLSAILPLEELIFPELPMFSDNPRNESKRRTTFFLKGGQKNFLDSPITTLDGEFQRKCQIEEEDSTTPRIVNERSFRCPSHDVGLSFRQVGIIDARDGMPLTVDLDYLLELGDDMRLTVKVRRLYGNDLATARAEAFKKLPPADWPEYFRRIPADRDSFSLRLARSADDIPNGQQISVSIAINERSAHGSRDYLARPIAGSPEGKVRVRLEGSHEELDVSPSSIHLPK